MINTINNAKACIPANGIVVISGFKFISFHPATMTIVKSKDAMKKMVTYCKEDVVQLEKVYGKLQDYCPVKKFRYKI